MSVSVDVTDPSVDPTPSPRVSDPENDSESLASDNADNRPPTDQGEDETYRERATEHHMYLRQGFPARGKYRNLCEQDFQGLQKSELCENTVLDCANKEQVTHMYRAVNWRVTKESLI